jgi:peptide/nickel transport system substrate-binding protein
LARPRVYLSAIAVLGIAVVAVILLRVVRDGDGGAEGAAAEARSGGMVRIALRLADFDSLDPALSYTGASGALLATTCADLTEVARPPRISPDGKTYTFTLLGGFRFSDGTPVDASAFARAMNRILAPALESPLAQYLSEIVGARDVLAGRRPTATGIAAQRDTLVVRLSRPVPEFALRTSPCAVPPTLPADPEGAGAYPAAGPYYVAEYRPAERIVIRRNRFYGGERPHRVDGFTVDLQAASHEEVLDRIERGEADWGWALTPAYLDPARGLVAKYGINRSQFFLKPGLAFRGYALNTSRPLFRNNPRLRQAVNFAIDRSALRRAGGGETESVLTDQYLPQNWPSFMDARIYPLDSPDLSRARELARGHTRGGKAVLYTVDSPQQLSFAQSVRQNLAGIGLDVQIKGFPPPAYFGRQGASGAYDIGFSPWLPDYEDPSAYINVRFDGRFVGQFNWARFNSPEYNRLMRRTALLQGDERSRAYGELDVRLARDAAPMVAIDFLNEPTLVSERLGCLSFGATHGGLDLAAVCLE